MPRHIEKDEGAQTLPGLATLSKLLVELEAVPVSVPQLRIRWPFSKAQLARKRGLRGRWPKGKRGQGFLQMKARKLLESACPGVLWRSSLWSLKAAVVLRSLSAMLHPGEGFGQLAELLASTSPFEPRVAGRCADTLVLALRAVPSTRKPGPEALARLQAWARLPVKLGVAPRDALPVWLAARLHAAIWAGREFEDRYGYPASELRSFLYNLRSEGPQPASPAEWAMFGLVARCAGRALHWYPMPPSTIEYAATLKPGDHPDDECALIRFLAHLESIDDRGHFRHRREPASESHAWRAMEEARVAIEWVTAFAPLLLEAYADRSAILIEILSEVATPELLDRLQATLATAPFAAVSVTADHVLRRAGRIPIKTAGRESASGSQARLEPLEPIRGQTWLNDDGIERLLYGGVLEAEEQFSQWYGRNFARHEMPITYTLMDQFVGELLGHVRAALEAKVAIANAGRSDDERWSLVWRDTTPHRQEAIWGADLGLICHVEIPGRQIFRKALLIQAKKMESNQVGSDVRFTGSWTIDMAQLRDLLRASEASFYLLLCPDSYVSQQRVVPATLMQAVLAARTAPAGKKPRVSDRVIAPLSHSLAQFLVYDVLSGWQGSTRRKLIGFVQGEEFPGAPPTRIIEVYLRRGIVEGPG